MLQMYYNDINITCISEIILKSSYVSKLPRFNCLSFFYLCFLLDWVLSCFSIGERAQSWILSASAKCGKADKAWRSRSAVRTATFKRRNETWPVTTTGLTYTNVKVLERFHGKVAFGIEGFKQERARTQNTTYQAREDFHFVSFLHFVAFAALYHGMPLCLGSVVKRATSRSKSPTPGSLIDILRSKTESQEQTK